jgi:hypothetical protein
MRKSIITPIFALKIFALLLAAVAATYFPILNNALVSDDYFFINRTAAMPFSEIWRVFTVLLILLRPLPILLWWVQTRMFGGEGLPSHLIDITLHTGAAWMLFLLMATFGCTRRTAIFSALLFALAPIGPDAVTWSAARMDTMALMFVLLAVFLYLKYIQNRSLWTLAGSLLAAAAALFSKEEAIILVVLMPVVEVIFGRRSGARTAAMRQFPFFLVFTGYLILRLALLGGAGGYANLVGMPRLRATAVSLSTFLSPLNNQIFSRASIVAFGMITGAAAALSLILVARNWRRAPVPSRRLWLFFTIFTVLSVLPVFWFFFVKGLNHGMQDSRFLYFPTASFVAMTLTGLSEFGPRTRPWRTGLTVLLVLGTLAAVWGVRGNNQLWEHASDVTTTVSNETYRLVPDPPAGSSFYYDGINGGLGIHIFGNNLQELIRWKFDRNDLRVSRLEPDIDSRRDAPIYFFSFDMNAEAGRLALTSTLPPLE